MYPVLSLATLVGVTLAGAPQATAELRSPKPWLKKQVDQAAQLAKRKVKAGTPAEKKWQADTKAIIDDMLDWGELTRRSLGRSEWKKRTVEEQTEFSGLLREMIETSYKTKLKLAARGNVKKPKKIEIKWLDESIKKDKAKLTAQVKSDRKMAVLEFHLLWKGNRWWVYDVLIDDVSTVNVYRSQFRKLIADKGFPAVLERMRMKIEDIREGRAELAP